MYLICDAMVRTVMTAQARFGKSDRESGRRWAMWPQLCADSRKNQSKLSVNYKIQKCKDSNYEPGNCIAFIRQYVGHDYFVIVK